MRWAFGNGGIDVEVFEVCGILVRLQHNEIQWRITGLDVPAGSFRVDVAISSSNSSSSSESSSSMSSCVLAVTGLLLFLFPKADSDWVIFDFFCIGPG